MAGPGKYDLVCSVARRSAGARAAILIVLDGTLGSGVSVQVPPEPELQARLPEVLRILALAIEDDLRESGRGTDA
jgi:hypothetical protein